MSVVASGLFAVFLSVIVIHVTYCSCHSFHRDVCVCVCVIQPDSSAVQGVETLEHSLLDLTRVNHLLAVLSHKKQQLEQVVAAFVYFSDATLSFTQFHISWQIWSVERGDTVGRVGVCLSE